MRIVCPKCGRPGSLRVYNKGQGRKHPYYRVEHMQRQLRRYRHYMPLMKALALLAAEPSQNRNHAAPSPNT